MAMYRPSQNHVIASEAGGMPARYRPSNQALLQRSRSANPSVADSADQLAGMHALSGNGLGDNGLSSGAELSRLARRVDAMRLANVARLGQLAATGSPNAAPVTSQISMTFDQAVRGMPLSPGSRQFTSSVLDRIRRNKSDSWEVVQHMSGSQTVYTAELVRTLPTGKQQILQQSDDLATEQDTRNYIQAHEFARTAQQGQRPRLGFNRDLQSTANGGAAVRQSQMVPLVASPAQPLPGMYQPGNNVTNLTQREVNRLELDGLGLGALSTMGIGGIVALGLGIYLLCRKKR